MWALNEKMPSSDSHHPEGTLGDYTRYVRTPSVVFAFVFSVKETEFVKFAVFIIGCHLAKGYSPLIALVKSIHSLYLTKKAIIGVARHIDSVGMEKKRPCSGGAHFLV
ncbi:unnamed protein product, partial [marine sediment metagenome]